ncbi:MAG: tRNA epoxyqueuosine(34) reductase QueG [Nitrospirae bacterium]|nr:tRNA epoxyqueuosine(34) reductase QueG [Nitrospirota bacterium]
MTVLADDINRVAREFGFAHAGIASARPLPFHQRAYRRAVAEGRHGDMDYLARELDRREDPSRVLPGAKTVISLAAAYYQGDHGAPPPDAPSGKIARYAWGRDYHDLIERRLNRLKAFILEREPGAAVRSAVDHAPVLERAYAQEAGLGFIGKHTLLITPDQGSWVLLAELITDLDLACDAPAVTQCGSCTRCLDACPTNALIGPFQLDAARCIAYLTIEHKGDTPDELRPAVGEWLFGCDVCQEVCPYNEDREEKDLLPGLESRDGPGPWLALEDAATPRSRTAFDRRFVGTALRRAGGRGLRRNAEVVEHNLGQAPPSAAPHRDGTVVSLSHGE